MVHSKTENWLSPDYLTNGGLRGTGTWALSGLGGWSFSARLLQEGFLDPQLELLFPSSEFPCHFPPLP